MPAAHRLWANFPAQPLIPTTLLPAGLVLSTGARLSWRVSSWVRADRVSPGAIGRRLRGSKYPWLLV